MDLARGDFAPELFRVLLGAAVQIEVSFHALHMGFADEILRGRIDRRLTHRKGL